MAEDVQALRAQFMKKEKFIKDVVRNDARSVYQFVSAVRKEFEKEKNIMAAKLHFLFKVAQAFAPGAPAKPSDDAVTFHGHLQKIVENQLKHMGEVLPQTDPPSNQPVKPNIPTGAMIKDIIQQYIETKELLKRKIKSFVLTRRAGMVQSRLDEMVRQMKASGGVEKFAADMPVDVFLERQEAGIVVDLVLDDMAEKTAKLDKAVNRIVEWRSRNAAAPAGPEESDRREKEMQGLVQDLIDEINNLKTQEKLCGETENGILNNPEGRAELSKLRSNLSEQKINVAVVLDALTAAKKTGPDGNPMLRPEEIQENVESSLNACDKIESLIKDERNIYLNVRKWESTPGKFQDDISLAAPIASS